MSHLAPNPPKAQRAPLFWFAGGGTGGHIFPGLAVAEELKKRRPDARFVFFGTPRPIDADVIKPAGHELVVQAVQPWPGMNPLRWVRFLKAWRASVGEARAMLRREHPVAVLGLGGYAAAPAMKVASTAGVPVAMHNPDAMPGRANRALARFADHIFCQWEVATDLFSGRACSVTGCPIRPAMLTASRDAGHRRFGLDAGKRTLLLTGASQGAKNINDALVALMGELEPLADRWQIAIIAGPGKDGPLQEQLDAQWPNRRMQVQVIAFTEHMPDLLAASDLVVSRAGASSCAEYTALGLPSILLPYPYDRAVHQRYNARVLVDAGAAVEIEDACDARINADALRAPLLALMQDEASRAAMAANARTIARRDAAEHIADEMVRLAGV